jgi:O-antigen/teichoic acid export membrane protein
MVICAFGLNAFVMSFSNVQVVKLRKRLENRRIALFNLISVSCALIAGVTAAFFGCRYWALVIQQMTYSIVYLMQLRICETWSFRLQFDMSIFKKMYKFGVNMFGAYVLRQGYNNLYSFLIGKNFSSLKTGYFYQAQKLQDVPFSAIDSSVVNTSFVLISNEKDETEKRKLVLQYWGVFVFVNSLVALFAFGFGEQVIWLVLGDKWAGILPYFRRLLLIAMFAYPISYLLTMLKVYNRSDLFLKITIVEKVILILGVVILCSYGIEQMLNGILCLMCLSMLAHLWIVQHVTEIPFRKYLSIFLSRAFIGVLPVALAYGITLMIEPKFMSLVLGFIMAFVIMLLMCKLFLKSYYAYMISNINNIGDRFIYFVRKSRWM